MSRTTSLAVRSLTRVTALLAVAVSVIATLLTAPAHASGVTIATETFDPARPGWWTVGGAGFDYGKNYAYTGTGNGWIRNTTGWNALNTTLNVRARADCYVSAWIRVSPNLTGGYMSVLRDDFSVITETRLTGAGTPGAGYQYNQYVLRFTPSAPVRFHFGMWGNGQDAWATIDELTYKCDY